MNSAHGPFGAETARPVHALDALYGVLFRPAVAYDAPISSRAGLAVVLLVALVAAIGYAPADHGLFPLALVTSAGLSLLSWTAMSGGVFLVSQGLYARGELRPLAGALGASFAPWLLLGPAAALGRTGPSGELLAVMLELVICAWWLRLTVQAIRSATGLRGAQALATLVVTELVMVVVPLVVLLLAGAATWLAIARSI